MARFIYVVSWSCERIPKGESDAPANCAFQVNSGAIVGLFESADHAASSSLAELMTSHPPANGWTRHRPIAQRVFDAIVMAAAAELLAPHE